MKLKLHTQIFIALVLAVIAGWLSGQDAALFGVRFYDAYAFFGTLFLNALKMIIVPLVMSSIISGIAGIGSTGAFGRMGGKTLVYYLSTSFIAILVGVTLVNLLSPGTIEGQAVGQITGALHQDAAVIAEKIQGRSSGDVMQVFLRMVPPNIIAAAADGQMLGLIFFSLLFGYFMTRIGDDYAQHLYSFWQGTFEVMMNITLWVMKFTPFGVFALVAKVVADTDPARFQDMAQAVGTFFVTVLLALAVHLFIVMPLILKFVARVNPLRHYRAMLPALLTAFSTASSSATLPMTMECVEKNAGVSNRTTSFVLPLGATVNMDGTALYECVAAMFIAQAYGLELSFATQVSVVMLALLTSIGVAGIPSASLVAISVILTSIGLPVEGLAMIYAVDRILDMCRTAVNVFSDSCGAVVVARLEGESPLAEPAMAGQAN